MDDTELHDFDHPQLVATLPTEPPPSLIDDLRRFDESTEVEVLFGEDGLTKVDPDGSEHGPLGWLKRTITEERAPIKALGEALEAGKAVVVVHGIDDEAASKAAGDLRAIGAEKIYQFAELTWREL